MTTTLTRPTPSIAELILEEQPNLRCVARGYVFCESDVDDLVQETLLKAYRARDRFRPGTSVRAWTTTILRRHYLTLAIRGKRRRVQTDTDAGRPLAAVGRRPSPIAAPPSPTLESLADHLDQELKQALGRVPTIHRTCFILSAVLDLSCDEIAQTIGVPRGTAMSRVHRAREQLRRDLAPRRRALWGDAARGC